MNHDTVHVLFAAASAVWIISSRTDLHLRFTIHCISPNWSMENRIERDKSSENTLVNETEIEENTVCPSSKLLLLKMDCMMILNLFIRNKWNYKRKSYKNRICILTPALNDEWFTVHQTKTSVFGREIDNWLFPMWSLFNFVNWFNLS